MSEKLVECVPNFSEGRDPEVIRHITAAVASVEGVNLLHVDSGTGVNRTVVTFAGDPDVVKEAAFRGIKQAAERIDMRTHTGAHPRIGATDVCPFVALKGVSVEECIQLSRDVAQRVGEELAIPVYLYEESAQRPGRRNLADIRRGGYESLEERLKLPRWEPDFGPARFHAKAGATVVGVRDLLIAFNVNLNTREVQPAMGIAFELRTKGCSARRRRLPVHLGEGEILKYRDGAYPCGMGDFVGKTLRQTAEHCKREHNYDLYDLLRMHGIDPENTEGESVKVPGKFPCCKALGWFVEEYDRAQVSFSLTDYRVTSMHEVLEETRRRASDRGLVVTGSEIVGMVPFDALLASGRSCLKKQGLSDSIPVMEILSAAVQFLGLNDVSEFRIEERVLGLPEGLEDSNPTKGGSIGGRLSEPESGGCLPLRE